MFLTKNIWERLLLVTLVHRCYYSGVFINEFEQRFAHWQQKHIQRQNFITKEKINFFTVDNNIVERRQWLKLNLSTEVEPLSAVCYGLKMFQKYMSSDSWAKLSFTID